MAYILVLNHPREAAREKVDDLQWMWSKIPLNMQPFLQVNSFGTPTGARNREGAPLILERQVGYQLLTPSAPIPKEGRRA